MADKNPQRLNLFDDSEKHEDMLLIIEFESKINKHFFAKIAAKIRWYLNYLASDFIFPEKNKEKRKTEALSS